MTAIRLQKLDALRSWATSFAAACAVTLAILLLLAFAHREQPSPLPASEGSGIRLETIQAPEETSASAASAATPNLSSLLPTTPPVTISPLAIDVPAVDVSVDLSQMLEWRYSYADLGARSAQSGSFGVSNFSDVDQTVENIIIPPKEFPDALIDAGVTEGRVVVSLLIDEKGHVQVKNVLSATDASLVPIVVEAMKNSIYSIPIRDGKPTKVLINRVIIFKADPARVAKRRAAQTL